MTAAEFRALFDAVQTWGRWGDQEPRGALNNLTPERVTAAAQLVRRGLTVTLSLPLNTEARLDCPEPADHHMTMLTDQDIGSGSVRFAKDYVGVDYHNDGHSHIDAFCHVAYEGRFYDGVPDTAVTADGAQAGSIDILKDGLIGRGVLLDVPRLRGVPWLEPGEDVYLEDLEAAEQAEGITVGARRHPPRSNGPFPTACRAPAVENGRSEGRPTSRDDVVPGRAIGRGSRLRREQRHGAEHDRRCRVPDPRPRDQRDGGAPPRLPAARRGRPAV